MTEIRQNIPISDNTKTQSFDKIIQDKTQDGSVFSIRKQQVCSFQIGEEIFNFFDTDKDNKLSTKNSKGENEINKFQQYVENLNEDETTSSNKSEQTTSEISQAVFLDAGSIVNGVKDIYNKFVNFVTDGADDTKIYYKGKIVDDSSINGKIDSAKQGHIGDCWLLSQLNALSESELGKQAIKEAITKNDDGSYNVRVNKHTNETIQIPLEEIEEAFALKEYSEDDLDVLLFELAYEKYYKSKADEEGIEVKDTPGAAIIGGNMFNHESKYEFRNIIKMLTDDETMNIIISEDNKDLCNTMLKEAAKQDDNAITFSSEYNFETREKFPSDSRDAGHAYSIKDIKLDENGEITEIIVINPWDNNKEISVTYDEFCQMAGVISISSSKDNIDSTISLIKETIIQNIEQCSDVKSLIAITREYSLICKTSKIQPDMEIKSVADDKCTELINKDPSWKEYKQDLLSMIDGNFS